MTGVDGKLLSYIYIKLGFAYCDFHCKFVLKQHYNGVNTPFTVVLCVVSVAIENLCSTVDTR